MLIRNITRNTEFEVQVADIFFQHIFGLMFSKPKDLLFKFSSNKVRSFWMFGVSYNINIAFVSESGEVFHVEEAKPLTFYPKTWKTYESVKPCKYVLETAKNLVQPGDILKTYEFFKTRKAI